MKTGSSVLTALLLTHYLNSLNKYSRNSRTIVLLSQAIVAMVYVQVLLPVPGIIAYLLILAVTYGITLLFIRDTQLQNCE
ncbi:hypothetical protein [Lentiprolixibacter aurantiacus]|uniref:Uncharacterized protein n=1 Tax=Lentiprolixibacter aurantiacus TaxID=2993939 RepID=A0AAE3MP02_9FLAO|nr:hypothetical protein [Lentiprolixibacter aurantiacus]MCX2720771.1 hypothetical protein [Lentiprolixibacter aurantiacus]